MKNFSDMITLENTRMHLLLIFDWQWSLLWAHKREIDEWRQLTDEKHEKLPFSALTKKVNSMNNSSLKCT